MIQLLSNPQRFMAFSRWATPILGFAAAAMLLSGLWIGFSVPDDYQQGQTVRLLFIHPQIAIMSMFVYACLAGASFFGFVFRHALADAAARAAAPLGAGFAFLALVTGSLWGRPMWGTWWEWGDARLVSMLVLFLLYLGYMALQAAIDDEAKAARAAAILALVGVINLPIIKYSVEWWNTLHQPASDFQRDLAPVYQLPFSLTLLGFMALFGALWLLRTRAEVWRRQAARLAVQAAGKA